MEIKVGCCGFAEAMHLYFREFSLVEIQKTFYQPPRVQTAQKWREQAPDDFEFTMKAWQLITHEPSSPTYRRLSHEIPEDKKSVYGSFKPTDEVFAAWEETMNIAQALEAKIILFQCPARFDPTEEHISNMRAFFTAIDRKDFTLCWEPRGDWPAETIRQLCQELGLVHAVDPFKDESVYGDIRYYRLHGITGYRYKFNALDLKLLLDKCDPERLNYVLFNNVSMLGDARRFWGIIEK